MSAIEIFRDILMLNKKGKRTGIYSLCSAHETVLKAGMLQAREDNSILLIESTSNQVNQDGGYTGMQPHKFAAFVGRLAQEMDFDSSMILLGGDHLGPNTWRHLPSGEAMKRAKILIHEYVKAGYQKIHLDASMFLADDQGDRTKPLADEIVAGRAAELCSAAEQAWENFHQGCPQLLYIIGTEVPIPGGAGENKAVKVTIAEDAAKTIAVAKKAFNYLQLQSAWERVCGVVVQPGVAFNNDRVLDYNHEAAIMLSDEIKNHANFVYEAHSTDYQTPKALSQMIPNHFCILKVGPWLTFAYREALFALVEIEKELLEDNPKQQSFLRQHLEKIMIDNPSHWEKYYSGTASEKKLKRKFSYLDRSRYYWPDAGLSQVKDKLYSNLRKTGIPLALISQYMPNQYLQVRQGRINCDAEALVFSKIREVLSIYSDACGINNNPINT
jgi:D-tagatose-1,6-bisphosphate aldolase subunit GatZ/KbaZ